MPTLDDRAGVFSAAIRDPLTGQPFANNTIPADRIDPYAAAILDLVPLPNQPGANNFFRSGDLLDNSDRLLGRADWHPATNDNVFARYIYSNRKRHIPGAFGGVVDGTGTSAFGNQTIQTNGIVGGWTRILTAAMVNEVRLSYSRSESDAVQQPFGIQPPSAATIPGSVTDPIVAGGLPGITIDGYFGGSGLGRIGSPDFLPKFQHTNQFEFLDTVSWIHGGHALKAGADSIMPMRNEFMDVPATRGAMRFRNAFTGNPMADYLLGYVSDLQLSNVWVVSSDTAPRCSSSRTTGRPLAALGKPRPALRLHDARQKRQRTDQLRPGRRRCPGVREGRLARGSRPGPARRNNFAPRIGVVYRLNDKTTVRGGWGLFYNLFDRVGSEDQLALNLPGLVNKTITRDLGMPVFLLQQGFPAGFLNPPNLDPAAGQLMRSESGPSTRTIRRRRSARRAPDCSVSCPARWCSRRTSSTRAAGTWRRWST